MVQTEVRVAQSEPSEYGGYAGQIQPEPHQLTPAEQARLERLVDPADASDNIDAVRVRNGDVLK